MSKIPAYVYNCDNSSSLQQGDIISLSGNLRNLFKKFYPGLPLKVHEKRYLMIISQTCDLVFDDEKNRKPKVDHINLCVVSKFSSYINRIRNKYQSNVINNYCILEDSIYREVKKSIAKLINNSESKIHFFLPQIKPFTEDMISVLSISYSFRTEHYNDIKENRILSLRPEFQSKIGSLIASFYNRIATSDLASNNYDDTNLSDFIDDNLGNHNIIPIDNSSQFDYLQKNKNEFNTLNDIENLIANYNAIKNYTKLTKIKQRTLQKAKSR